MAVKTYKPTTPGRRDMTSQDFDAITAKKPLKSLTSVRKQQSGRNNTGRITVRHRGGGAKRFYRNISFKLPVGFEGAVEAIEYDPNRTAHIARVKSDGGVYHYVIATTSMKVGDKISTGKEASISEGNRMKLKDIPVGTTISSIELTPGRGAQLVRSAGASATLSAKEGDRAQIKLPSGEVRAISIDAEATIGVIGNEAHQNIVYGKAGRKRNLGIRPTVRGVVMNAVDHPHGGGDGGSHAPGKDPRTPWGQKTLGYKTRRRKDTSRAIIRTRHQAKRRK